MSTIAERLTQVTQHITDLEQQCGRQPGSVTLLAVSKTFPAEAIREAASTGQRQFGENYVQEVAEKITALTDLDLEWHFIGPIQSNKTKILAQGVSWVHTVDREKIAKRLNDQRPPSMAPLNVCIQVNISNEPQKAGVTVTQLPALADFVASQPHLQLRGLMAIPAAINDRQQQYQTFMAMRHQFEQLQQRYPQLDTLSMGMSGDMDEAIRAGTTMVRIGSAIFGKRDYSTRDAAL